MKHPELDPGQELTHAAQAGVLLAMKLLFGCPGFEQVTRGGVELERDGFVDGLGVTNLLKVHSQRARETHLEIFFRGVPHRQNVRIDLTALKRRIVELRARET